MINSCAQPKMENQTEDTFRADGVAQVVQCLLSKSKALSSSPSATKKREKRRETKRERVGQETLSQN
jgi:hypothetical protein